MMRGLVPVRASYEETSLRGGPVVRLSTSIECATAYVQKAAGAPFATRLERVSSIMLCMARSATPNLPALSLWIVPTTRVGVSRPALRSA
eukprot:5112065-Pleurochrysis_carterae.AAC.1